VDSTSVRATIDIGLEPGETFEVLVDELARAMIYQRRRPT
jgi:hypothetical protein